MAKTTSPALGRAEQKEQTRQRLIETTINLIATEGVSNATLAKVARESGYSQGLVNFHFRSKEQLMLEALNHVNDLFVLTWKSAISHGAEPCKQLVALIHAMFHPSITNSKEAAVWAGFWSEARTRSTYNEIFNEKDDELNQQILHLLEQIKQDGQYQNISTLIIANGLLALIQGYELDLLLTPESYDQPLAIQSCFDYLSAYFPKHFQQGKMLSVNKT